MTHEEAIKQVIQDHMTSARNFLKKAKEEEKFGSVRALYVEWAANDVELVLALLQKEAA